MAVVPKCTRPQSAFVAQITEKPGRRIGERDPRGRSADVAGEAMNNQAQELFNRTANLFCEPLTGLAAAPAWAVCPNPPGNKVLRIRRQFLKSLRSLCAGELAKLDQQWNSVMYRPRGITLLGEVLDVAFDRFADPSFAAPIDGVGKNKVALQHDNLLSAHAALKGIVCWRRKLCAHSWLSLSTISSFCSQPAHNREGHRSTTIRARWCWGAARTRCCGIRCSRILPATTASRREPASRTGRAPRVRLHTAPPCARAV